VNKSNSGWVKFFRTTLEEGWLTNHKLWAFLSYCLLKASYKKTSTMVENQQVTVLPGQFVFGRLKAAKELKMSESNVRTYLSTLRRLGVVKSTTHPTKQFSIITVVNWDIYQSTEDKTDQPIDQATTNLRPGSDHIQEREEGKKKDISSPESGSPSCPHEKIIKLFHEICPGLPKVRVWNETRRTRLQVRWREDRERQNLGWWRDFFEYVAESPFLMGKIDQPGRRPFVATLDWIVKSENFAKIVEGKYQ
jgi:hypothetical protein